MRPHTLSSSTTRPKSNTISAPEYPFGRTSAVNKRAWKQALRPKPCKLVLNGRLRQAVIFKLKRDWSPEQIAGWLKRRYPAREAMHVSHETIYKSLYVQARGALKKELVQYLRSKRQLRGSRYKKANKDPRLSDILCPGAFDYAIGKRSSNMIAS